MKTCKPRSEGIIVDHLRSDIFGTSIIKAVFKKGDGIIAVIAVIVVIINSRMHELGAKSHQSSSLPHPTSCSSSSDYF